MQKKLFLTLIFLSFSIFNAYADQDIEIVGGTGAGLPKVAIVKFANDDTGDNNLSDVIANDLSIMGEFNVKEYDSKDQIDTTTQYVITASVTAGPNNSSVLNYQLQNHLTESAPALINQNITINSDTRRAGHKGSNAIYQQITNVPGAFTSKIAYILQDGSKYQIVVADYDGFNQKILLSTHSPIISLDWDSTGNQIAYVSFESNKPVVYVQDLYKVNRYVVSNFSGSNSSPAFGPTGSKQLAVTLTKDYDSHIYLINNSPYKSGRSASSSLINYGTIDTEASIGKNGAIVFTSNHDGGPQIFMTDLKGSAPVRQTINLGNYNTTARLSHDLSKITFINRNSGVLKTFVMDLATKASYPVSQNTSLDMAPSFAPNDKLILFSSNGFMYLVNTTGTTQSRLKKINGNIIDQRWGNNPE